MTYFRLVVALIALIGCVNAFSALNRRSFVRVSNTKSLCMISLPFFNSDKQVAPDTTKIVDKTIGISKSFVSSNFGLNDDSLLADDCIISGPTTYYSNKQKYLSALAKEQSAFLRAVPDYDVRAYSFAIDKYDSRKIWFKIRPRGTITGPFSDNGEVYLPNQKNIEFPIQQMSITVNNDGLISKMTTGYVIDKFVGNTNGLVGREGLLYALDNIPSKFTYLPPAIVLKQIFSRNRKPQIRNSRISPFPVAVMESLANAVLNSNFGVKNPSLLDNNFLFSTPFDGPYSKNEFLSNVINQYNFNEAFPDFDYNAYNIEVDQYDPERVWLITKSTGTLKKDIIKNGKVVVAASNQKLVAPPEAISFSFNEEGLCYKVSAGYVVDKLEGNSNGLGGYRGIIESVSGSIPVWEKTSYNDLIFQFNQAISGAVSPRGNTNIEPAIKDQPEKSNNQSPIKIATASSATKPPAPAVKPPTPVTKPSTPAVKPPTPAVKPPTPVTKPSTPVTKPPTPAVKPPASRPASPKITTDGIKSATTTSAAPKAELKKNDVNKPTFGSFFGGNSVVLNSNNLTEKPAQIDVKNSAKTSTLSGTKSAPEPPAKVAAISKTSGISGVKASTVVPKTSSIAAAPKSVVTKSDVNKPKVESLFGDSAIKTLKSTGAAEKPTQNGAQQSTTKASSAPAVVSKVASAPKISSTAAPSKQDSVYSGSLYSSRLTAKQPSAVKSENKQSNDKIEVSKSASQKKI